MTQPAFTRDLGDGLVLRWGTPEDTDALRQHHAISYVDPAGHPFELVCWGMPGFEARNFTLVEDARTGEIVSSMCMFSEVWTYEGIPVQVGRPESVKTEPAYRRRGLMRLQFEEFHRWSQARGELLQALWGIPWFYRQFGYEPALALTGCRRGKWGSLPPLEAEQNAAYAIRPAQETDLPFIAQLYDRAAERQPVHCLRSPEQWQYELTGRYAYNTSKKDLYVIERAANSTEVGFIAVKPWLEGNCQWLTAYEIEPAVDEAVAWRAITPAVMRFLHTLANLHARQAGTICDSFSLELGDAHPAYASFPDWWPEVGRPLPWYLRVADLPAFVHRIAPALEKRLAASPLAGYNGLLALNFYRSGLQLTFEAGRLARVEPWSPAQRDWESAASFPGLTFLQLLFGHRSVEELEYAFPDCLPGSPQQAALLDALFPKCPAHLWLLGWES